MRYHPTGRKRNNSAGGLSPFVTIWELTRNKAAGKWINFASHTHMCGHVYPAFADDDQSSISG
jgi:hypothetical protein